MIKKIRIAEGFEFSDDNFGVVANVGIDCTSEPDEDFVMVTLHEEGLWITDMPEKEDSLFVYFPIFDFGTYIHKAYVEEAL